MNVELFNKIEAAHIRKDLPNFKVGDTISINIKIKEGDKQRVQNFTGLVIAIKGSGTRKMFTARKISYGVGIEKTFPWNSPLLESIKVIKHGSARRAKLYFLRGREGKLALKVKPGEPAPVIEHAEEAQPEEVEVELAPEVVEEIPSEEVVEIESAGDVAEVSA